MSKILEAYADILKDQHRFVDEIFTEETYYSAVPHLTIIDLGAYEGEFGMYCYNFADKIYAFEPDPKPFAVLKKRVEKFSLDKIVCLPLAVGPEKGERMFHASGAGGSKLLPNEPTSEPENEKIIVQTVTLKDFMEENNIETVDILKVDIEGGENDIFKSQDFKEIAPKIKLIIGEHLSDCDDALRSLGFKPKKVEGTNTLYTR